MQEPLTQPQPMMLTTRKDFYFRAWRPGVLDRYVAREIAIPIGLSLLLVISTLIIARLLALVGLILNQGVSVATVLALTVLVGSCLLWPALACPGLPWPDPGQPWSTLANPGQPWYAGVAGRRENALPWRSSGQRKRAEEHPLVHTLRSDR